MNIGVLGTGMVGQALGSALAAQGHAVMFGTRDVEKTLAGEGTNAYGVPVFGVWYKDNANKGSEHKDNTHKDSEHKDSAHLELGTFAEAARFGDLLVNATNGMGSLEALHAAGADNLGSKILIDVANELDFSGGMPPRALATTDRSLGEAIQAAFPTLRVVKTLNTINASVMVDPALVPGGDSTVFINGNDAEAKAQVTELLRSFGWQDVMDLGDVTASRAAEMLLPVWVRAWGVLGNVPFNFKIVR